MSDFETRFSSHKQDWATPDDLWLPLHKEFHFTLDAAAGAENTKCKHFFTMADNGLTKDWKRHKVWLNPPYGVPGNGSLQQWVAKAWQSAQAGATVVMLIPARTNTNWFHDTCLTHGEVRFIRGRPKFSDAPHGLPQPLCVVIFRAVNQNAKERR